MAITGRIYCFTTTPVIVKFFDSNGYVIARKNSSVRETFTVRRLAYGTGVERTFPLNAPIIEKIEVTRRGKVRRAKLYYLRDRVGKATKVKELLR